MQGLGISGDWSGFTHVRDVLRPGKFCRMVRLPGWRTVSLRVQISSHHILPSPKRRYWRFVEASRISKFQPVNPKLHVLATSSCLVRPQYRNGKRVCHNPLKCALLERKILPKSATVVSFGPFGLKLGTRRLPRTLGFKETLNPIDHEP